MQHSDSIVNADMIINRDATTTGLLAAMSDRDVKTLLILALLVGQRGSGPIARTAIAHALGCTPSTASERIQSLLRFRWQGQPLVVVTRRRRVDGTWDEPVYTLLPSAPFGFATEPMNPAPEPCARTTSPAAAPIRAFDAEDPVGGRTEADPVNHRVQANTVEVQSRAAASEAHREADDSVATDIRQWDTGGDDLRVGMARHGEDRTGAAGAGVDRPNVFADAASPHVGICQLGNDPYGTGTSELTSRKSNTGAALTRVGESRHGDVRHGPQTIQDNHPAIQDYDQLLFFPDSLIQDPGIAQREEASPLDPQTPSGSSDRSPHGGTGADTTRHGGTRLERRAEPRPVDHTPRRPYSQEAKALADRLKARLQARGVTVFPRDWHVKALASAAFLLKSLPVADVEALMDWALAHPYWGNKTTTMHQLVTLAAEWQQARQRPDHPTPPRFRGDMSPERGMTVAERNMTLLRRLYAEAVAEEVTVSEASG